MKIKCNIKGSYKPFIKKLEKIKNSIYNFNLEKFGELGVKKLKESTPKDSGDVANSWSYSIENTERGKTLSFNNNKVTKEGTPIVILLEYGHATRGGTWFSGYNFINPSINQVIVELIDEINSILK
ncbi:MAG: HK97 gp10 family phage protein [Bacilli bacterium]|nr:HK97 gp10 family phage protein [Bacilli bacterium]